MNLESTAKGALDELTREGVAGEIFLEDGRSTRVAVSDGKIEALEERRDRGAGVRVFEGGRAGFSFTADLSSGGIAQVVSRAREIAALVASDDGNRLPEDPGVPATGMTLLDPALAGVAIDRKIALALDVEREARGADRRVSGVREAAYQDFTTSCYLANTAGLTLGYAVSRAALTIELAASEAGESQVGWHGDWRTGCEGLDPSLVGREAARKATVKLGAEAAATKRAHVVLSPEVTASLMGELSALFSAEAVLKGRSLLADRIGSKIASDVVTLVDDGRHPRGYSSTPVDGEGVATRENVLIANGTLTGYLHSVYTSVRMGLPVTGNAGRGGYTSRPGIAATSFYLRPSGVPEKDLIAGVTDGFYVMEVMGLHTISAVTGDFSIGASGLKIESGRFTGPVDRMVVAGNILDLLGSIEAVADDLRYQMSGVGSTLLLRGIAVSGR